MKKKQASPKSKKRRYKLTHRIAAALTAGAMASWCDSAYAVTPPNGMDVQTLSKNITHSGSGLTQGLSAFGYIAGSSMVVLGIMRLKTHVDNPAATPMREGLMRLVSGGALLSLPFMMSVMQGSVSQGMNGGARMGRLANFASAALPVCDPSTTYCDAIYGWGGWNPP